MFSLQLLTKAYALDDSGLTPQERELLDGAWFAVMNAPPEYADTLAALYGENGLEEESRIREVRACAQIESSSFLKETIEAFHEADEIGDIGRLRKAQSDLFRILEDPANQELHRFYHSLFDAFCGQTRPFRHAGRPRRHRLACKTWTHHFESLALRANSRTTAAAEAEGGISLLCLVARFGAGRACCKAASG